MSDKKRGNRKVHCFISSRRVDAREIRALARSAKDPLFHVSGSDAAVEFLKGMLKLLGVPARRITTAARTL